LRFGLFETTPFDWNIGCDNMSDLLLVIEDNGDDIVFLKNAFSRAGFLNPIEVVRDGEQAISYLQGHGVYADRASYPIPALVLLDLIMPRKSGFEVLEWIKEHSEFKSVPVIVLSGMSELLHLNRAYRLGAQTFIRKPLRANELSQLFARLKGFHFIMAPEGGRHLLVDRSNG
jgi:CheY-like chemotaxis protein